MTASLGQRGVTQTHQGKRPFASLLAAFLRLCEGGSEESELSYLSKAIVTLEIDDQHRAKNAIKGVRGKRLTYWRIEARHA